MKVLKFTLLFSILSLGFSSGGFAAPKASPGTVKMCKVSFHPDGEKTVDANSEPVPASIPANLKMLAESLEQYIKLNPHGPEARNRAVLQLAELRIIIERLENLKARYLVSTEQVVSKEELDFILQLDL